MKKKGSIAMIAIHAAVWILLTITLIVLYSWSAVDGYVNTMIKIGGVTEEKIEEIGRASCRERVCLSV